MTTRTTTLGSGNRGGRAARGAAVVLTALAAALVTTGQAQATMPGEAGRIAVNKDGDIWTAAADGTDLRRLTSFGGGAANPRWSPDGQRILFEHGGSLWVMRADGSAERRLFPGTGASWSPDGRSVAYYDSPGIGEGSVVTRPLAGGQPRIVDTYAASGWNDWQRSVGPATSWSPNGRSLLYGASSPAWCDEIGCEPAQTTVAETDLRSDEVPSRVLAQVDAQGARPFVDYAPDGRAFVFATNAGQADGKRRLFVGDRATGRHRQLTRDAEVYRPVVTPDGGHVVYGVHRAGGWEVRRTPIGSGAPVTVLRGVSQPDVQPLR